MKSYTDLKQSKKLAEILNEETADLWWDIEDKPRLERHYHEYLGVTIDPIPCWSVAALLDILKDNIKIEKTQLDQSDIFTYSIIGDGYDYRTYEHENLVDACVEMILKLHELNLLCL